MASIILLRPNCHVKVVTNFIVWIIDTNWWNNTSSLFPHSMNLWTTYYGFRCGIPTNWKRSISMDIQTYRTYTSKMLSLLYVCRKSNELGSKLNSITHKNWNSIFFLKPWRCHTNLRLILQETFVRSCRF